MQVWAAVSQGDSKASEHGEASILLGLGGCSLCAAVGISISVLEQQQYAAGIAAPAVGLATVLVMQQQRCYFATQLHQAAVWCSWYLIGTDELRELVLQATVNGSQPLTVKRALGCVKQTGATGISSLQAKHR